MAQQTAVEWLLHRVDKYTSAGVQVPNTRLIELINKAKEMEKEQLKRAYYFGIDEEYHYTNREDMFDNFYKTIFKL